MHMGLRERGSKSLLVLSTNGSEWEYEQGVGGSGVGGGAVGVGVGDVWCCGREGIVLGGICIMCVCVLLKEM